MDIEALRRQANGTSNRDPLVAAVSAEAPANVQHIRSRSYRAPWTPIQELP